MDTKIADRLQKLRKERGYSQEQLADELGVSRQAVSKWERGEASPDTDNLIALARLYEISVDDLLFEKSDEGLPEPVTAEKSDEEPPEPVTAKQADGGQQRKYHEKIVAIVGVTTVLLSVISYVIMGVVWDLWSKALIVYFIIPVIPSLAEAIDRKAPNYFCFPVLVTGIYLLLGVVWHLWHPWWVIFLTIPIYYLITSIIKKK